MAFLHHTLDTIFLKSSPKRELKGIKKFLFSNYHMKQQLKSAYGAISTEDYWLCSYFYVLSGMMGILFDVHVSDTKFISILNRQQHL